jgi:DNA-binding transcriptional ArsR family regulator
VIGVDKTGVDKTGVDHVLAVLAEPTRRAIVDMLRPHPARAGEIHAAFPIADTAISRHLRVLREAGLVVERRVATDGRIRLYELVPSALAQLADWINQLAQPASAQHEPAEPRLEPAVPEQAGPGQAQLDAFRDYVAVRSAAMRRSPS